MKKLKLIGAALGAVGVLLSLLLPRACERRLREAPPTMVEDLRSGRLPITNIVSITYSFDNPGLPTRTDTVVITNRTEVESQMQDLAEGLAAHVHKGHTWKNHPSTVYPVHDLKIELQDGSIYTLDYTVAHNWYQEDYFFSVVRVRPKILPVQSEREARLRWWFGTGIGPSVSYESRGFVQFVREHDPFFPDELKRETGPNQGIQPTK